MFVQNTGHIWLCCLDEFPPHSSPHFQLLGENDIFSWKSITFPSSQDALPPESALGQFSEGGCCALLKVAPAAVPGLDWHSGQHFWGGTMWGMLLSPSQEYLAFSCLSALAFLFFSSVLIESFADYATREQITWRKASVWNVHVMNKVSEGSGGKL